MELIKEPEGIDFVIKSKPLTDKERTEISEFIRQCKAKGALSKSSKKKRRTPANKTITYK